MERGLADFFSNAKNLECLDLSENEHLSGYPSFANLPANLKHLNLATCYRLVNRALLSIRDRCVNLEILNLHRVDLLSVEDLNSLFEKLAK